MKKIKLLLIISALLLTQFAARSQSNFTIDAGAMLEIQTGADVCADTRTINGILTGNGTWCLIPLSPAPPVLVNPVNLSVGLNLSLNLIWQRSFGAVTYRVQLAADSLFTTLVVNDSLVIDSVRAVSGLSPLTYYWWRVNAKGIGGTSSYSAVYKFRTLGYPNPVSLINPPNNAVNQPTSIQFRWSRSTEQTGPFENSDNSVVFREKKIPPPVNMAESIDAISNYWFDLVTDTVSLANLTRDTLLTDTTKSVSGLSNLTNYWWRVKAKNQIGWGSYSLWYKFTTITAAPPPPVLVSPLNNASGQNLSLTLVWNKSSLASTYRVQVAADSLFTTLILNDSTLTDSTRAISGLTPLTNYWWRVNAKNIGGTSSYSAVWKFRTLGTPNPVSLINPPNNATNQPVSIQFRWSKASEQTSPFDYSDNPMLLMERKMPQLFKPTDDIESVSNYWFDLVTDTVSLANLTRDTTLTDTTKSVSGLTNNISYYWRVKAKNQIGWGSYSVWYKFTTIVAVPPPPVLVSPLNNATGQNLSLTLVWNKSSFASTYRVQLSTDSLFGSFVVNDSTLTDSIRAVSGLTPLTNYWWRVNAKNVAGTSSFSSAWKFKTMGAPTQVVLVSPANGATNQPLSITFVWRKSIDQLLSKTSNNGRNKVERDNPEAISNYWYELTTDTVSMANLVRDSLLTDTTRIVGGLTNLTTYYWHVRAKNQVGWGQYSAWWRLTTQPLGPAQVTLTVIPGGFYNTGTGMLNMKDTIRAMLIDSAGCLRLDSAKGVIDSVTFSTSISFNNITTGKYYLYIFHRNHIFISARYEQNIVRGSTVSYNFTTDSAKAYGFNMIKVSTSPVRWGMIPGDANRDGFVDGLDQTIWIAQNGLDGYLSADFNGDYFVDGLDQTLWILWNGQSYFVPCELSFENPVDHSRRVKEIYNKQLEDIMMPKKNNR